MTRLAPQRHRPLITGVRIKVVTKNDDLAVLHLLEAKPDAFVRGNALNERERALVVLRDVFMTRVLRTQLELEIDAVAVPVMS